jgi:hypothetical protein
MKSSPAEAVVFVNAGPRKPPVNHLHELEMRSALRQKARRGEFTLSCRASRFVEKRSFP